MKQRRISILAGFAAVAMLTMAGSSSATTVTSTGGATTGNIQGYSIGHATLHNSIVSISCSVTLEGSVESHGSGVTAEGKATTVNISECTNEWVVDTVTKGTITVHWTSGNNGILTSSGTTAVATRAGLSCAYATSNTTVGTVTGGNPATLKLEMSVPRHGGSFLCGGSTATLTGTGQSIGPVFIDQ
jgi:hypothetical protein